MDELRVQEASDNEARKSVPKRVENAQVVVICVLALLFIQINCSSSSSSSSSSLVQEDSHHRHDNKLLTGRGESSAQIDSARNFGARAFRQVHRRHSRLKRQVAAGAGAVGANLNEYLDTLPVSSVGQKHAAVFECDMSDAAEAGSEDVANFRLIDSRTAPTSTTNRTTNDIQPLSLNKRVITPDRRFRVQHRPPSRWLLTIDNVGPADDKAFYLCQFSGKTSTKFIGGARLNVLAPPKIIEHETSPNLVAISEFSALQLRCKVISEPQSQISWRREDGRPLEGLEQRFKHQLDRQSRPHQLLSVDSSELLFESIRREQAGAYLCIASNGVQPGVSQRVSVVVENCHSEGASGKAESCQEEQEERDIEEGDATMSTTTTTTTQMTTLTSAKSTPPTITPQTIQNVVATKSPWRLTSMSASGNMSRIQAENAQRRVHGVAAPAANQTRPVRVHNLRHKGQARSNGNSAATALHSPMHNSWPPLLATAMALATGYITSQSNGAISARI